MILDLKVKIEDRSKAFQLIGELNLDSEIEIEKFEIDGEEQNVNNKKQKNKKHNKK